VDFLKNQLPLCLRCSHYRTSLMCDAFPGGIPDAILRWEHDHRESYKGDNGIRFGPIVTAGGTPEDWRGVQGT